MNKKYAPQKIEPSLSASWRKEGIYHFNSNGNWKIFSIDTPPTTVSGNLHMGHVYSYSHPDFIARFRRMKGDSVFYPMGYDDNGLPTDRLTEKLTGKSSREFSREAFTNKCIQVSKDIEEDYEAFWQRLGLSIDWRYTYRTMDQSSWQISQHSFIDLFEKELIYQREAPVIWCPECMTAIAQAELNDIDHVSKFNTLKFDITSIDHIDKFIPVATTRPELLPACVAIFVHPDDHRYQEFVGSYCSVPLFGREIPVLEDKDADPNKGTGAVMCCTFGDRMDIAWWYKHQLPLIHVFDQNGNLNDKAAPYGGLSPNEARKSILQELELCGHLIEQNPIEHTIRVHERCDTPIEYSVSRQWFINVTSHKKEYISFGESLNWVPKHMLSRYRNWVENIHWDWCISRQRRFGIPFPVWYCNDCGEVKLADQDELPVNPVSQDPSSTCSCGSSSFSAEQDVMDTWATSSLTPQIAGKWQSDGENPEHPGESNKLYKKVFPFTMRPQAHEIIRTWVFYTIVKSFHQFNEIPWKNILISGWGLAGEGSEKISKSKGGGGATPIEMINRYSADAVRYWAASAGPGKDSIISEEKIKTGQRLVTKLWNVSRFCKRLLVDFDPGEHDEYKRKLTPADKWILARLQTVIQNSTESFENYEYSNALSEIEKFFWQDVADNYIEMCKQRLYYETNPNRPGAIFTLYEVLKTTVKLFAPFIPFVTEEIYQIIFSQHNRGELCREDSIHLSSWPTINQDFINPDSEQTGSTLIAIASSIRRYKSENNLALSTQLERLDLYTKDENLRKTLLEAHDDLLSITRVEEIRMIDNPGDKSLILKDTENLQISIQA